MAEAEFILSSFQNCDTTSLIAPSAADGTAMPWAIEGTSEPALEVDTKSAADERDSRKEIVRQIDALRDAVSGVSLDEEAMQLMKFQRAYEANARFFQVIDRTLETLIGLSR